MRKKKAPQCNHQPLPTTIKTCWTYLSNRLFGSTSPSGTSPQGTVLSAPVSMAARSWNLVDWNECPLLQSSWNRCKQNMQPVMTSPIVAVDILQFVLLPCISIAKITVSICRIYGLGPIGGVYSKLEHQDCPNNMSLQKSKWTLTCLHKISALHILVTY